MKITELMIGKTLLVGVIISAILVLGGGLFYLQQHGTDLLQATHLSIRAERFNTHDLAVGLYNLNPLSYVLLGVMFLFFTQLVRVAMAALIFLAEKNIILFAVSGFVFLALLSSVLINL